MSVWLLIGQLLLDPAAGVIILITVNGTAYIECSSFPFVEVDTMGADNLKRNRKRHMSQH